jgi:3',5'-cyclic AMP phosphodiesterase CpdA
MAIEPPGGASAVDGSIDWIIVQMHQDALSSSATGNGSDLGLWQAWLPLFDRYQVDLVLCGHDHDYERSFPVRGYDAGVWLGRSDRPPRRHPPTSPGHDGRPRIVRHVKRNRPPRPRRRRDERPAR